MSVCDESDRFNDYLNSTGPVIPWVTVIVLDSATTGTDKAGYELCVGPHRSGTRGDNSSPGFC